MGLMAHFTPYIALTSHPYRGQKLELFSLGGDENDVCFGLFSHHNLCCLTVLTY